MANFDTWVTDPRFSKKRVQAYLTSDAAVGTPLHGALVCTSLGVTGNPGIFVHDEFAVAVCQANIVVRGYLAWIRWPQVYGFLRRGVGRPPWWAPADILPASGGYSEHGNGHRGWRV